MRFIVLPKQLRFKDLIIARGIVQIQHFTELLWLVGFYSYNALHLHHFTRSLVDANKPCACI